MMSAAAVMAAGATCGTFALAAAAAPLAQAGNPLARLTADQIAKKAVTDLKAATSFHYHGSTKQSGEVLAISMSVTHNGCTGSIRDGSHGTVAILSIGSTVWLQPSNEFWEYVGLPASDLSSVQGKWLKTTGTGSNSVSAAFAPLCDTNQLVSTLAPQLTGLVKGKTVKVSGHAALQLQNSSGQESIYVSISSKPEILRTSDNGTINFSAYGASVTLTPPPAADVITLPSGSSTAHSLQRVLPGI
jgi:hypothetical protein